MHKKLFIPCIFLFAVSCASTKKMGIDFPSFDKEAHRGGRGLMPENTIASMLNGLSFPVTTLEMDAMITKDRQVILSHDPFFNHDIVTLPGGKYITAAEEKNYRIFDMTYAETQQYDVGLKPYDKFPRQQRRKVTKPLLADVIDSADAYALSHHRPLPFYNIETKSQQAADNILHPAPEEFVRLLMAVINSRRVNDRVVIQSFDPRTLQIVHRDYPRQKTSLLIEEFDRRGLQQQLEQLGFTPTVYSPAYKLVNRELLKACHALQMKVVPWTVNDKAEMERLKELGVDGVITDYPDLF